MIFKPYLKPFHLKKKFEETCFSNFFTLKPILFFTSFIKKNLLYIYIYKNPKGIFFFKSFTKKKANVVFQTTIFYQNNLCLFPLGELLNHLSLHSCIVVLNHFLP